MSMIPPITTSMLDSSRWLEFVTALSIGVAVVSSAAWLRSRHLLAASRRETTDLEKSSCLLEVEHRIVSLMDQEVSLQKVLDILTHAIEEMAPECLCSVLLLDEDQLHLCVGSDGGLPEEYMRAVNGLAIGPEVGACGSAAFRKETIVVEDIATDPRFSTVRDFVMSFGLRACWSVPILGVNDNILGTFAMYHLRTAKPRDRELALVEAGASLAANAIVRLRASERLRENAERIALAEKAAFLGIWELDLAHDRLTLSQELAAQIGLPDAALQLNTGQLRTLIYREDWPIVLAATRRASTPGKLFHAEFRVQSDNGHMRWLRTQARAEFSGNRLSRMIGVSVDITKEKETLELLHYQAAHDALTGTWNRRAIFELMNREFEIAARTGASTGLMMLDLDHFKNVNDTYGHVIGDVVLKQSVQRLQQAIRSYDLAGRYGGEEFLVVLPRCDADQIRQCAERVRLAFEQAPILAGGFEIRITVSIGATVADSSLFTEEEALATADSALCHAKNSG